jgi:hypothetical protein
LNKFKDFYFGAMSFGFGLLLRVAAKERVWVL